MSDTATKILNLLERLSVVASERCQYNPNDRRFLMVFVGASAFGWRSATQPTDDREVKPRFMSESLPHIHYAVLEEAHARGWEWTLDGFGGWTLWSNNMPLSEAEKITEGNLLEREVLPRLEALVLALETKGRAM